MGQGLSFSAARKSRTVKYCARLVVGVCVLTGYFSGVQTLADANPSCDQNAASHVDTINPGEPISRQINGGGSHSFRVKLTDGQYLRLLIVLHGIIVRATLFDPKEQQLVVMSNPSGGHGSIHVSEIAASSGDYRLEVRSNEGWANPGSFDASIEELRPATPDDKFRLDAERSFAKAATADDSGSFSTAVEEYGKALSYWNAVHDVHWQALTYFALGQTFRRSGDRKKAAECFAESLKFDINENDWRVRAAAVNDLGFNTAQEGDNEKAISLLNESLRLFESHGDRRGQASSLNNLSITYGRMGELRKAREFAERALPLREAENFQAGLNNLRNTLGNIYERLGDPYQALSYHSQALQSWQQLAQANQLDGPDRLANAYNNAALANEKVGNWDQASQYYEEALKIPTTTKPLQAAVLNNKGGLYAAHADFEPALTYLERARAILDSLEKSDPDLKASVMLQIGQIHASTGKLDQALDCFQRARVVRPNNPKLAYILTALGDVWSRKGNTSEALKAYHDALDIQRKIEDRSGQALTRQKLGDAYAVSGDRTAALNEYELALSLWRAVIDRRGEAETLNNMALIERDRNNLTDALERSEEATTLLESLRTGVASRQLRTSYFASHENFYELNIDLNMLSARRDQSTQHLATAFAASEKSRARSLIDALTEARADVSEGVSPELVSLKRALEFRLRAKLEAQTILLSSKFQQSEREAISKEVSDLIRQQEEVSGRIRSSNPKYSQLIQPQPLTLVEIQHQLDDNTILLEYALGKERSYVWLVSPNSINGFELASRDQIESVARRVTDALTARNRQERNETFRQALLRFEKAEKDYTEASASLSKMILDPVASLLGKKRVVVVADGALQMIPFAALPLSESSTAAQSTMRQAESSNAHPAPIGARALISEHEIISLLSASVLALQRQELANRKTAPYAVAVLADPVFDFQDARVAKATGSGNQPRKNVTATGQGGDGKKENKFELSTSPSATNPNAALASALRDIGLNEDGKLPRLTHSLQEARAIARAVPADQSFTALGFKASRETAISPELSKYRIIHFATHGVLDLEHPDLSGIVLSLVNEKGQPQDGYLRLHDIYNLNLPAELVVLSACQTGIGKQVKGEGLIALTRGFMYAGAKSVVASLWKVDDAATSALMADFYKQMFTNKLKPAAALRAAQLNLSQQKRWSSPYYWAGFFIQGEWN